MPHDVLHRCCAPVVRQARIRHEILLSTERFLSGSRHGHLGGSVVLDEPALLIILQIGDHDLIEDLGANSEIQNWSQDFDLAVEAVRYQVSRTDVNGRIWGGQSVSLGETVDSRVLEIAANNTLYANVLRHAADPGTQTTDPTNDEFDPDPGLTRLIKRRNDLTIYEGIHLRPNSG